MARALSCMQHEALQIHMGCNDSSSSNGKQCAHAAVGLPSCVQALTPPRNARDAWLRMQAGKQGMFTTKPAGGFKGRGQGARG